VPARNTRRDPVWLNRTVSARKGYGWAGALVDGAAGGASSCLLQPVSRLVPNNANNATAQRKHFMVPKLPHLSHEHKYRLKPRGSVVSQRQCEPLLRSHFNDSHVPRNPAPDPPAVETTDPRQSLLLKYPVG